MPRRENEERNSTFSSSRAQNRTQFGLYRGEKTKNEIQRFLRGHTAYIDYDKDNGTIVLTHTFVPEAYEGRGVGAQLVAAALADIRRQGLKVVPQCSFVAVYIKRHPEWSDMVSETAGAER